MRHPPKVETVGSSPAGHAIFILFYIFPGNTIIRKKGSLEMYRIFVLLCLSLAACNHVHMKPGTLDKDYDIYTTRGGYNMRQATKEHLEQRGYKIKIGKIKSTNNIVETDTMDYERFSVPQNAKYLMTISERSEKFRPIWCALNGFWWWNFNISIVNQQSGDEILSWRGRGCANSSLRKLDKILDKLEK